MLEFFIIFFGVYLFYFLLFLVFHFLKKRRIALHCFAYFCAPRFGFGSKTLGKYCKKYCPGKKCSSCRLWTCEFYSLRKDKDN